MASSFAFKIPFPPAGFTAYEQLTNLMRRE
jgi:hypothetical protein